MVYTYDKSEYAKLKVGYDNLNDQHICRYVLLEDKYNSLNIESARTKEELVLV